MKKTLSFSETLNSLFIVGMLIAAGVKYISESIFLNVKFFIFQNLPQNQSILAIFFITSLLTYFFIISELEDRYFELSIKRGYITGTIMIILTLIFVNLFS